MGSDGKAAIFTEEMLGRLVAWRGRHVSVSQPMLRIKALLPGSKSSDLNEAAQGSTAK